MIIEFRRQPRFFSYIPKGEIEVPNPPSTQSKPEISWFTLLVPPAIMMVITILIAMTSKSLYFLISIVATVMSLIVSLTNAASQIKKFQKCKKEREEKYLQFIADTRSELTIAKEQQIKSMREMNPDPEECFQRMVNIDNKLWERTPSHNDFLSLRVGIGSVPHNLKINYTKQAIILENDPLLMEPHRLALEFQRINDVPVTLNLVESEICGIAGDKFKAQGLVKNVLIQCVTHHGYDDVRIVILASTQGIEQWNWMKYIPHIWNNEYTNRYILCGKTMAHKTLSNIQSIIKEREFKKSERDPLPHYIFIVEDSTLLENEPISKYLYENSSDLGISAIFIAPSQAYLPMNCRTIITIDGKNAEITDRLSGEKAIFAPDNTEHKNLDLASRKMASLRIKSSCDEFSLPNSITLLEMLKVEKVIDVDAISFWKRNKTYMGMNVPIGAKAGGEPFYLDMHETGYGPHGLVAGTTGSGKSELLQSIIISLAINYHPHDIVFVLIDYKGGGMADVFENLPHLVGTITNLGGNQTNRALLSIKSELLRRQRIFSEYGVNNIDKYQKLYYTKQKQDTTEKLSLPAIPHLIMIADEFAELKQDQPEFMKELVSTARVGRSLGVHLILATQKPAGVVDDQIWSNSKFKICLKVQDEQDSKDVIKRPDAAMIKEPGRAYIQVGNDEVFDIFQSAFSGADYDPEGEMTKNENKKKRIYKVALDGKAEQIYPLFEEKISKVEVPSQLEAMVEYLSKTTEVEKINKLDGPWMPPLPEMIYLDEFYSNPGVSMNKNTSLSVPLGLVDDPRNQMQKPFFIDFNIENNLIIYGAAGTGKTNLLKSISLSLAHSFTPQQINIYIMDFGGSALKVFENLPHCGGVMTLEQESRINQFMLYLDRIMNERKKIFEESGSDNFRFYNQKNKCMPAIILIIDNYIALSETYELIDEKMVSLAREGSKYGIYLIVTTTNTLMIRYKFNVNFKMALCFQMIDKSEYSSIVGRTDGIEPLSIPGRGLLRGNPPLEIQTAFCEFKEYNLVQIIERFKANEIDRAEPIPIMPEKIEIEKLKKCKGKLTIGLCDTDLQPVYLDLFAHPVLMIAGEAMSGKSTILMTWIKMLDDSDVYVIDSSNMSLIKILRLPHVTGITNIENEFIEKINDTVKKRREQLINCQLAGDNIEELIESWRKIVICIDRLSEFTNSDKYSLIELIERITKKERGLKISVIAADTISEFMGNWSSLCKVFKDEQTGILLGSMRNQDLFNLRTVYGTLEKEIKYGDGYLIKKNKYLGLRLAVSDI